jgi:ABC-2 type transport system permease protein
MRALARCWMVARWTLAEGFRSWTGWISLIGFTVLNGLVFSLMLWESSNPQLAGQGVELHRALLPTYFSTMALLLLLICPALSMNSISGERLSNRWVLLQTSVLSSAELILGKGVGLWLLLTLLLIGTMPLMGVLAIYSSPHWTRWLVGYFAVWLVGALYMTIGIWSSARTTKPILSWLVATTLCLLLWFIGTVDSLPILQVLSPLPKVQELLDGWVGLFDVAYFAILTAFLLYHTQDRLNAEVWVSQRRPLEHRITPWMWFVVMGLSLTLVSRTDRYWDWNHLRTILSEDAQTMLTEMGEDLHIVIDLEPTDARFRRFEALSRSLPNTTRTNIEWLNHTTRPPTQTRGVYLQHKDQTVALTKGISIATVEQGLQDLLYPTTPVLCFTQGGGEPNLFEALDLVGMGLLSEHLINNGYDLQPIDGIRNLNENKKNCSLVVVSGRTAPIGMDWLNEHLIQKSIPSVLLIDPTTNPIPTDWLSNQGVTIHDDFLLEPNPQFQIFGDPSTVLLSSYSLLQHPHLNLDTQHLLLTAMRSVSRNPNHTEHLTVELLRASPQSWAELDYLDETPTPNNADIIGNIPLMVEVSQINNGEVLPKPQLIILGTSSLIHNKWIQQNPYNAQFFTDMVEHLLQEERLSVHTPSDVSIQVSTAEVQQIGLFAMLGLPSLLLLWGWRRN